MSRALSTEYLQWFKTSAAGRFDLRGSGVLPCTLQDLGAELDDIAVNGPGGYGFEPLQQAIATHCGVDERCVVAASGTSMANFVAMAVLVEPGDEVLIESPAYEPLLAQARFFGAVVKRFPRGGNARDFVSSRTKLIIITNLHNPTCALLDPEELKEWASVADAHGARVLVDEVYLECMYEKTRSAFRSYPQLICTSSLTKAYGLGGVRCGWILAAPDLARRMWYLKDVIDSTAPHPAERLSVVAFRNLKRLASRAKSFLEPNRRLLSEFLNSCSAVEAQVQPYGSCVFPKLRSGRTDEFIKFLHTKYETDVVPGRFFDAPDHFRLGIGGDPEVFAEGIARLQDALAVPLG